ncbi:MAG: hypothetical protein GY749_02345 [Desulfobacteraceae bacterium]|nr:hypothetical protein [Desulfobacteraceae bacterium]
MYFNEKQAKLGINREGRTLEIPCRFTEDQREEMIREIREYLVTAEKQTVSSPEQISGFLKEIPEKLKQQSKETDLGKTAINKTVTSPDSVSFHINIKTKKNIKWNDIVLMISVLLFSFLLIALTAYLWSQELCFSIWKTAF